jgi:hypothetical protein
VPQRSGGLEGALQRARFLEPPFEVADAAPQDEIKGGDEAESASVEF